MTLDLYTSEQLNNILDSDDTPPTPFTRKQIREALFAQLVREKDAAVRVAEQAVFAAIDVLSKAKHWSVTQLLDTLHRAAGCLQHADAEAEAEAEANSQPPLQQVRTPDCRQGRHSKRAGAPEVVHHCGRQPDPGRVFGRAAPGRTGPHRLGHVDSDWCIVFSDPGMVTLKQGVIRLHCMIGLCGF